MTREINCPVCHFEHIPQDRETCPQCDADLICFRLLDALPDSHAASPVVPPGESNGSSSTTTEGAEEGMGEVPGSAEAPPSPSLRPAFAMGIIILLMSLVITGYALWGVKAVMERRDVDVGRITAILEKKAVVNTDFLEAGASQVAHLEKRIQELVEITKANGERLAQLALTKDKKSERSGEEGVASGHYPLSKKVPPEPAQRLAREERVPKPLAGEAHAFVESHSGNALESDCFISYQATDTDTLWDISQALYGAGIYYPVLLEYNPDLKIYDVSSRDTIRYLCDRSQAVQVYKKITGIKKNRRYWKYTVRSGDTRTAVCKRYCLNRQDCLVEDTPLEPGMIIGIFLE